jgi:hypothetical protein
MGYGRLNRHLAVLQGWIPAMRLTNQNSWSQNSRLDRVLFLTELLFNIWSSGNGPVKLFSETPINPVEIK